jgi:hypothetical protein
MRSSMPEECAPGLFTVSAKVPGARQPYGSATTTTPASLTTFVVRARGRAARRVSSRKRFTITLTFTPSGGGAAVTKTVAVKPRRLPAKKHLKPAGCVLARPG